MRKKRRGKRERKRGRERKGERETQRERDIEVFTDNTREVYGYKIGKQKRKRENFNKNTIGIR